MGALSLGGNAISETVLADLLRQKPRKAEAEDALGCSVAADRNPKSKRKRAVPYRDDFFAPRYSSSRCAYVAGQSFFGQIHVQ